MCKTRIESEGFLPLLAKTRANNRTPRERLRSTYARRAELREEKGMGNTPPVAMGGQALGADWTLFQRTAHKCPPWLGFFSQDFRRAWGLAFFSQTPACSPLRGRLKGVEAPAIAFGVVLAFSAKTMTKAVAERRRA